MQCIWCNNAALLDGVECFECKPIFDSIFQHEDAENLKPKHFDCGCKEIDYGYGFLFVKCLQHAMESMDEQ